MKPQRPDRRDGARAGRRHPDLPKNQFWRGAGGRAGYRQRHELDPVLQHHHRPDEALVCRRRWSRTLAPRPPSVRAPAPARARRGRPPGTNRSGSAARRWRPPNHRVGDEADHGEHDDRRPCHPADLLELGELDTRGSEACCRRSSRSQSWARTACVWPGRAPRVAGRAASRRSRRRRARRGRWSRTRVVDRSAVETRSCARSARRAASLADTVACEKSRTAGAVGVDRDPEAVERAVRDAEGRTGALSSQMRVSKASSIRVGSSWASGCASWWRRRAPRLGRRPCPPRPPACRHALAFGEQRHERLVLHLVQASADLGCLASVPQRGPDGGQQLSVPRVPAEIFTRSDPPSDAVATTSATPLGSSGAYRSSDASTPRSRGPERPGRGTAGRRASRAAGA